jgi:Tol biopolymer transport system component
MSRVATVCALVLLTACGSDPGPSDPDPTAAGLELSTFTQGAPPDPDGYLLQVDEGEATAVAANDTLSLPDVDVGEHRIALSGLAANCVVAGPNPRTVVAAAGLVTKVRLAVTCSATTGELRVEVSTHGIRPDIDGYVVAANGTEQPIEPNATLTISDLPPGDLAVTLAGIAANCQVLGDNPRTVSVSPGVPALAGFAVECAASPEGRLLVSSDRGGTFHLYRVNEDGSDLHNLTPSQQTFGGDWSPDGARIVFSAAAPDGAELMVMSADGSGLTPLGVKGSSPRWSPDGRTIAFSSGDGITLVDQDGTNRRVLVEGTRPDWSPDGQHIAFDRTDRSRCLYDIACPVEIFVIAVDGTGLRRLLPASNPSDAMTNPRWSPDGAFLAYGRSCCFLGANVSGLYTVSADGSLPRRIYPEGVRGVIAWSPDGSTIAVPIAGANGKTDIFAVPRGGGTAAVLLATPGGDYPQAWR